MTTDWLVHYPPDIQLRFNGVIHACLVSLTDPLPLQARSALERFVVDVVTMEEICSIAAAPANPSRLRASCFAMLVELHSWSLTSKRRKVLVEYALQGSRDADQAVRKEAVHLLGQINSDHIMSRQAENSEILETMLRLVGDKEDEISQIADAILTDWADERRDVEDIDAEVRERERE